MWTKCGLAMGEEANADAVAVSVHAGACVLVVSWMSLMFDWSDGVVALMLASQFVRLLVRARSGWRVLARLTSSLHWLALCAHAGQKVREGATPRPVAQGHAAAGTKSWVYSRLLAVASTLLLYQACAMFDQWSEHASFATSALCGFMGWALVLRALPWVANWMDWPTAVVLTVCLGLVAPDITWMPAFAEEVGANGVVGAV